MTKYREMFDIEAAKFSDLFSPLISGFQCYCKVVPYCKSILCRVNIFFPLGVSAYFGWMCSWVEKCKVKVNFCLHERHDLFTFWFVYKIYEVWFSSHIVTSYCLHLFLSMHLLSKIYIVCNTDSQVSLLMFYCKVLCITLSFVLSRVLITNKISIMLRPRSLTSTILSDSRAWQQINLIIQKPSSLCCPATLRVFLVICRLILPFWDVSTRSCRMVQLKWLSKLKRFWLYTLYASVLSIFSPPKPWF